jgi:DMSO/TMAO reductase YedYZ molybdopterin-dependent catalytic subunit
MPSRREFLKKSAGSVLLAGSSSLAATFSQAAIPGLPAELSEGARESAVLEALPGKFPLIKKSYRPPNYETPVEYFAEPITPNKAFFVRYHLASIPEVDAAQWRLKVGGESSATPFELSLEELKKSFEPVELTALCLCSGNRRGMFQPHVAGVEWGLGAMGNALWKGARLKDLLAKSGIKKEAVEVTFNGADAAVVAKTPDFVKSIPVAKALDENTLIAYEMNGAPIPHWNGFPARVIVPGWTGTYWMKHVTDIDAVSTPFQGFWMKSAYRIPKGKFPIVDRFISQETDANTPITEMVVASLITSPASGQQVRRGQTLEVVGLAWDAGYGINGVEVSVDGGETWRSAKLGKDHGRFSFRQWNLKMVPETKGTMSVLAKATNRIGATQTFELIHNPAGYHHNVVQRVDIDVV